MRYVIIDAMNFFIRSFSANPTMDLNGEHIGGFHGFYIGVAKIIREFKPDGVFIVWDGVGGSLKRRSIYKEYKSGRKPKLNREYDFETVDEQLKNFTKQIFLIKEFIKNFPLSNVDIDGVEADDVIAYIVNHETFKNDEKIIVSSDKDFYQLLNNNTFIYSPIKKILMTKEDLITKYSLVPENFIYYKSITGDKSDNIDGIKGIGDKTFFKMFSEFLNKKEISNQEFFNFCEEKKDDKKFQSILDGKQTILKNIQLMQLSHPNMIIHAAEKIRASVENRKDVSYKPFEVKMMLMKFGITIENPSFFDGFKQLLMKVKVNQ